MLGLMHSIGLRRRLKSFKNSYMFKRGGALKKKYEVFKVGVHGF